VAGRWWAKTNKDHGPYLWGKGDTIMEAVDAALAKLRAAELMADTDYPDPLAKHEADFNALAKVRPSLPGETGNNGDSADG